MAEQTKAKKLWEALNFGVDEGGEFSTTDLAGLAELDYEASPVKQAVSAFTRKRVKEGLIQVVRQEGVSKIFVKMKQPTVDIEARLAEPTDLQFIAEFSRRMKALVRENKTLKKGKKPEPSADVKTLERTNADYVRMINKMRVEFDELQRKYIAQTAELAKQKAANKIFTG